MQSQTRMNQLSMMQSWRASAALDCIRFLPTDLHIRRGAAQCPQSSDRTLRRNISHPAMTNEVRECTIENAYLINCSLQLESSLFIIAMNKMQLF